MLFVLQNTVDDSLAKFVAKRIVEPGSVMATRRTIEVEVEDDDADDFEEAVSHAGFVVMDRQEPPAPPKRSGRRPSGQGFVRLRAESSSRRSPYESPWRGQRAPRDPWG